ncbi:MAG: phage terminase large subunit [Bacteroidetes bacterium]|nr:phage terminase large subunit [Bacteroidota bacterium]
MFETTEGGYLISTGVNGSLTSKTVDILIMDDLYKGKMDAYSPIFRQRVLDFYNSVAETRLHNGSKQLILYTRWHEEDLAGVLLEKERDIWYVSKYEAIKETFDNEKDKRELGEPLWAEMHSKEKLLRVKKNDPEVFQSLMQQDPRPTEGLLYENIKTYSIFPTEGLMKSYTDTADEGSDFLASIVYTKVEGYVYVKDIIYTQKKMELTEPMVADSLIIHKVKNARIESNNGGKGFARNVKKEIEGKANTNIKWFHQSKNKEARILSAASNINKYFLFPDRWEEKFPLAHKSLSRFLAKVKANEHDDLQDCLSGIEEEEFKDNNKLRTMDRSKLGL